MDGKPAVWNKSADAMLAQLKELDTRGWMPSPLKKSIEAKLKKFFNLDRELTKT